MYDKPILRAENVKKIYGKKENEIEALRGVDLDICEGEFISIMGSSGAGKSTLLLILAGMDKPTAGEVFYCDRSLCSFNDFELAKYSQLLIIYYCQHIYMERIYLKIMV